MNIKLSHFLGIFLSLFISHALWSMYSPKHEWAQKNALKIDEWQQKELEEAISNNFPRFEAPLLKHLEEVLITIIKPNSPKDLTAAFLACHVIFFDVASAAAVDVARSAAYDVTRAAAYRKARNASEVRVRNLANEAAKFAVNNTASEATKYVITDAEILAEHEIEISAAMKKIIDASLDVGNSSLMTASYNILIAIISSKSSANKASDRRSSASKSHASKSHAREAIAREAIEREAIAREANVARAKVWNDISDSGWINAKREILDSATTKIKASLSTLKIEEPSQLIKASYKLSILFVMASLSQESYFKHFQKAFKVAKEKIEHDPYLNGTKGENIKVWEESIWGKNEHESNLYIQMLKNIIEGWAARIN